MLPSAAKRRSLAIGPCLMRSVNRSQPAAHEAGIGLAENSSSTTHAVNPADEFSEQPSVACKPEAEEPAASECATPAAGQLQTPARKRRRGSMELQLQPASQRRRGVQTPAAGVQNRLAAGSSDGYGSDAWQPATLNSAATPMPERTPAAPSTFRGMSHEYRLPRHPSQSEADMANPILLDLPCRGVNQPAAGCSSPTTPSLCRSTLKQAIASPPDRKGPHAAGALGAVSDAPVSSKLSSIVLQYLRHQHKTACLKAAAPISTLPPMSLLRPNTVPQVCFLLNLCIHVAEVMQFHLYGGLAGLKKHLV